MHAPHPLASCGHSILRPVFSSPAVMATILSSCIKCVKLKHLITKPQFLRNSWMFLHQILLVCSAPWVAFTRRTPKWRKLRLKERIFQLNRRWLFWLWRQSDFINFKNHSVFMIFFHQKVINMPLTSVSCTLWPHYLENCKQKSFSTMLFTCVSECLGYYWIN